MRDLDALKAALLAQAQSVLPSWFPAGRYEGGIFMLGDISGAAGRSLKVSKDGRWKDWASGESGSNLLELYAQHHRLEITKAYDDLAPAYGLNGVEHPIARKAVTVPKVEKPKMDIEMPVPPDVKRPSFRGEGEDVTVYEYRGLNGELLCIVYRRDYIEDGERKKKILPYVFGTKDGKRQWHAHHPRAPKPLYNQPWLAKSNKSVIIVSGEKCVDALQPLIKNPVVTWMGGDKGLAHADWSVLKDRNVLYWPDNDESGRQSVPFLAVELEKIVASLKVIHIPEGLLSQLPSPAGADVADIIEAKLWSKGLLRQMAEAAQPLELRAPSTGPTVEITPAQYSPIANSEQPPPAPPKPLDAGLPVPLGMRGAEILLLDRRGPDIIAFTRENAGRRTLQHAASTEDWERSKFGAENRKTGRVEVDWDWAAAEYVEECLKIGQMRPDSERGRGVFMDSGRIVANLSREGLWVDGELRPYGQLERSKHIYLTTDQPIPMHAPMPVSEAIDIAQLIHDLRWADPWYAVAFAGWLAMAPVCGALEWRPNLWISGQSGSGKSYLMNEVAKPLIAPIALSLQGNTTEAGVRQALNTKARPVLWDEFEAESKRAVASREAVLQLIRQVCGGDSIILKGSSSGGSGVYYYISSTFMFASINSSQRQRADIRRTLTIELATPSLDPEKKAKEHAAFREIERTVGRWDKEIGLRWVWRSVHQAKNMEASRRTLVPAIMADGTSRSTADQMSAYLAGYWSLMSDSPITPFEAETLVKDTYRRWRAKGDPLATAGDEQDEISLVRTLLDQTVLVTVEENDREQTVRRSLRELVKSGRDLWEGSSKAVNKELSRFGLRLSEDRRALIVAATHPELTRLLAETPWADGWEQVLRRLPGAMPVTARNYTVGGKTVGRRGTAIPLEFCELGDVE